MGDNRWLKNSFVYLIILVAALALFFNYFNNQQSAPDEKGITEVIALAKAGDVATIEAQSGNNDIFVTLKDNPKQKYRSRLESNDSITNLLIQAGVDPGIVSRVIASSTSAVIDAILRLTGNM